MPPPPIRRHSIWRSRIIVAIILLIAVAAILYTGNAWLWAGASLLLLTIAAHEWARLCGYSGIDAHLYAGGFALFSIIASTASPYAQQHTLAIVALSWVIIIPWWIIKKWALHRFIVATFGIFVLYAGWHAAQLLFDHNQPLLLAGLTLVWLFDSICYFVGRAIGSTPLAPAVSPKKTVEGLLGGITAILIAAALYTHYITQPTHPADPIIATLSTAFALTALALLGDLFISALKRHAGVKDTGALLGDHGGILDRIDALLPVLPVVALLSPWTT